MQILNSKAYYLKNYASNRRHKTQHKSILPNKDDKISEIVSIRSLNRPMKTLQVPRINTKKSAFIRNNQPSVSSSSTVHLSTVSAPHSKPPDALSLYNKEKSLLQKVIDQKEKEIKQRRSYTVDTGKSRVLLEAHPLGQINTIEVESMKPTDRYFHQLQNVRIAERLLLAKASDDCNRITQTKFFRQQKQYKTNISKLHIRTKKEQERSRVKLLNRKKWID